MLPLPPIGRFLRNLTRRWFLNVEKQRSCKMLETKLAANCVAQRILNRSGQSHFDAKMSFCHAFGRICPISKPQNFLDLQTRTLHGVYQHIGPFLLSWNESLQAKRIFHRKVRIGPIWKNGSCSCRMVFLQACGLLGWTVVVVSTCKHLPMILTLVYFVVLLCCKSLQTL